MDDASWSHTLDAQERSADFVHNKTDGSHVLPIFFITIISCVVHYKTDDCAIVPIKSITEHECLRCFNMFFMTKLMIAYCLYVFQNELMFAALFLLIISKGNQRLHHSSMFS